MNEKTIKILANRFMKYFPNYHYIPTFDNFIYYNERIGSFSIDNGSKLTNEMTIHFPVMLYDEFQNLLSKIETLYVKEILDLRMQIDVALNWLKDSENIEKLIQTIKNNKTFQWNE